MRGAGAAGEARRATGAGVGKGPRGGAYADCPRFDHTYRRLHNADKYIANYTMSYDCTVVLLSLVLSCTVLELLSLLADTV